MEPLKTADKVTTASKPVDKKKYIANGPIYHEGKDYAQGDEIEVSDSLAAIWLANETIAEPPTK
jgi:hypothetical protein